MTLAKQVPQNTHEGPCDPLQPTREGQGKEGLCRLRTPPFLKKEWNLNVPWELRNQDYLRNQLTLPPSYNASLESMCSSHCPLSHEL